MVEVGREILDARAKIANRIRAAVDRMEHDARTARVPITRQRRDAFLAALRAGVPVSLSATYAGCAERTLYKLRQTDPAFREAWELALESSIESVEERLIDIALDGPIDSMATVRAAETVLKGRSARYRQVPIGQQAASASVNAATGTISVSVGTPTPD